MTKKDFENEFSIGDEFTDLGNIEKVVYIGEKEFCSENKDKLLHTYTYHMYPLSDFKKVINN